MADVESVVAILLQKLSDPPIQEAIFLHGVGDQVEWLYTEFRRIRFFLEDIDAKQEEDEKVKLWVRDVRDVAYNAEDVFDAFVFKIASLKRRVFVGCIRRYAFSFNELIDHPKVGLEIKRIKKNFREISKFRSTYGIEYRGWGSGSSSANLSLPDLRLTSPLAHEPDFVGFEKDLEILVARLTEGELRRCVVSVFGMGGLGKTTLTMKVYNNTRVKTHFHYCAWISISQQYVVRDLLQNIINCYMVLSEEEVKKVGKMNAIELRQKISEFLQNKRYLMVVDDIWTNEAWDELKDAFPDMNNGSRVMLTTQNKDVAFYADTRRQLHELQFLNNEESWDLFCKKTFPGRDGGCPRDLEGLGREIVEKCHGLPLAIVLIGGLLARKKPREWKNVHKSISWQFVKGDVKISSILSLSYKDLPHHLKPCFLYLGIFPEDYEFCAKKLIQLWAAEGLLQQRGDETVEEMGEDCLKELIQRSMIQLAKRSSSGGIISFHIHDALRDLSISEAMEDKFLNISNRNSHPSHAITARRLTLHQYTDPQISSMPHLRSLLCFKMERLDLHIRGLKLLRVLDLEGACITEWSDDIGELIHLRYLGLRQTDLKRIPPSAGNLRNLLTLDVKFTNVIELPDAIQEMKGLQHLYVNGDVVIRNSRIMESLIHIQTIPVMDDDAWMEEGLAKLTKLRKLGISGDLNFCSKALSSLSKLQSLRVGFGSTILDPALLPRDLVKLHLERRIEKLHQLPQNLVKLSLRWSLLEEDPLVTLEKLQNLKILLLGRGSFVGKKIVCSSGGFCRLEFLKLDFLNDLEEWRVEQGALRSLNRLAIRSCRRLKKLPEGLQHVTTLNMLESSLMPDKFEATLDDWCKNRDILRRPQMKWVS